MLEQIPTNILPWLVGSVLCMIFGLRALNSYRNLHSKISMYFAIVAFGASISWLFWALPLLIFPENRDLAVVTMLIGDFFNFAMLFFQARLFWYLSLRKINFWVIGVPVLIVAIVGLSFAAYSTVGSDYPAIVDGEAIYPTSSITSAAQALLIVFPLLVGISLLFRTFKQSSGKSRIGTLATGLAFTLLSTGGLVNVVSSSTHTNDSPYTLWAYAIGLSVFFVAFLSFRLTNIFKS